MMILAAYDTVGSHNIMLLMTEKAEKFYSKFKKCPFQVPQIFPLILCSFNRGISGIVIFFFLLTLFLGMCVHLSNLTLRQERD